MSKDPRGGALGQVVWSEGSPYNTSQAEYHVVFTKTALSTLWAKWFFVEARHFLSCDNQTYPCSNCATEVRTHELGTMRTLAERMLQCIQRSASHLTQLQDWRDCSASPSVKTTLTTWQRLTRPRSEKRRKGMKTGVGAVWGMRMNWFKIIAKGLFLDLLAPAELTRGTFHLP